MGAVGGGAAQLGQDGLAMVTLICCSAGASEIRAGIFLPPFTSDGAQGRAQPLTMARARRPAPSLPECLLVSAGRLLLDKQKQHGFIPLLFKGGCGSSHRRRCPRRPPAGWRWTRPRPTWTQPGLRRTNGRAEADRGEPVWRLQRIRVVLQQDLPLRFPPLRLFRKRPGDFEKLLSCC